MGLDGVSVNQLRLTPENNSAELNSQIRFQDNNFGKIDGLSEGQRVDSEKRNRQNNSSSLTKDEEEDEILEESNEVNEQNELGIIKYDLSNSKLYFLKLDETTNKIMIIEKATGNAIQVFDADDLTRFVGFMPGSSGALVNKRL